MPLTAVREELKAAERRGLITRAAFNTVVDDLMAGYDVPAPGPSS